MMPQGDFIRLIKKGGKKFKRPVMTIKRNFDPILKYEDEICNGRLIDSAVRLMSNDFVDGDSFSLSDWSNSSSDDCSLDSFEDTMDLRAVLVLVPELGFIQPHGVDIEEHDCCVEFDDDSLLLSRLRGIPILRPRHHDFENNVETDSVVLARQRHRSIEVPQESYGSPSETDMGDELGEQYATHSIEQDQSEVQGDCDFHCEISDTVRLREPLYERSRRSANRPTDFVRSRRNHQFVEIVV